MNINNMTEQQIENQASKNICLWAVSCQNAYFKRNKINDYIDDVQDVRQADIKQGLNLAEKADTWDLLVAFSRLILELDVYKNAYGCPVKKFKRLIGLLWFAASGNPRYLMGNVNTAVLMTLLALSGVDMTDREYIKQALAGSYHLDAGHIPANFLPYCKKAWQVLQTVDKSTSPTQISVVIGGECPILLVSGIMNSKGQIIRNSKVLHGILKGLSKMTESSFNKMVFEGVKNAGKL